MKVYPDDFKYPSKDEFSIALSNFPKIKLFGFRNPNTLTASFNNINANFNKSANDGDLYNWDKVFHYRLNNLKRSYIFTYTHFYRGIYQEGEDRIDECKMKNEFMFEYYSEIFYYHLVTLKDTILHVLNCFYDCKLKDYQVNSKNLLRKLNKSNGGVSKLMRQMEATKIFDIRNIFTHRFPVNVSDTRIKKRTDNKLHRVMFENEYGKYYYTGKTYQPQDLMKHIDYSLSYIEKFILQIQEIIKAK